MSTLTVLVNRTSIREAFGPRFPQHSLLRVEGAAVRRNGIPMSVRVLYLLFVFTLPLDAAELSFLSNYLTVAKIFGLLFFASYVFHYCSPLSRRKSPFPPSAVWWFLGYVAIYGLNGLFMEQLDRQFFHRLLTLIQLVVFLQFSSSLLQNERLTRDALLAYSLAAVLVALTILAGVSTVAPDVDAERLSALGEDPNNQAVVLAIGALMLIGLRLGRNCQFPGSRVLLPSLLLPLLAAIVYTGSRTGLSTLIVGTLPCLLLSRARAKITAVALVIPTLFAVIYFAASHQVSAHRWNLTFEEGNLARRDKIFASAIEMIAERPLFGWHPVELWDELGRRTKTLWKTMDAHNLYLHLLLEVGVVGAFPFFVGLWLCTRAAWKGRAGYLGPLPLALLLAILAGNVALTWLARKPMWFVLALCLAAGARTAFSDSGEARLEAVKGSM